MPVMKSFKHCFLFIILLCCVCQCSKAQQWIFEALGADRGLPASEAYGMIQDQQGYIYVSTEYGLVKYNGIRFVEVCNNIPTRERIAYAFCKTKDGKQLFINSQFRIYTIRNDSAFNLQIEGKTVPPIRHSTPVNQLFEDSAGNMYASTPYKTFRYEKKTGMWDYLEDVKQPSDTMFIEHRAGTYFGNFVNSIVRLITITNAQYAGTYRLDGAYLLYIRHNLIENNHGLYTFVKKKILRIDKQRKLHTYDPGCDVISITTAEDGHLWVGTHYGGLLELDGDLHLLNHYLDKLSVVKVLFDRQNGIWATTLEQGVFHSKNVHEYHYDNVDGLSAEIRCLKHIDNKLFAATGNGSLLVATRTASRVIKLGQRKLQDVIPWNGGYLIAASDAVIYLDSLLHARTVVPSVTSYLLLSQQSNLLCFGATSIHLFSGNYALKNTVQLQQKIQCILPIGDGSVLSGSTKGLFIIGNDSVYVPPVFNPLFNCNISDIKKSKDGNIWIGTKGDGLFLLKENRVLVKVPVPSEIVTNINFFKDSIVLIGTNTGLYSKNYRISSSDWKQLYYGEVQNALPFDNKIFIGTKHGLIAYDTTSLFHPPHFPVYLSSVSAGNRTVDKQNIRINYSERDIYFNFDVLSYSQPAPTLHYQLTGPVPTKGKLSGTQLFLQNLQPGHYKLAIYLGTDAKNPVLHIPFYIQPAFWQTRIFIVMMIVAVMLLLSGSAFLLYRRTQRIAYKKAAVERMLSEYKLTALKAQINPHFISNSLSAIQELVLSGEIDKASRYLALFSLLIRHVLQYSDKSLVPLGDELKIIELNVSLEQLRFSDQFHFEQDIANDIEPTMLSVPPLITQPFIENAIWHGLLPLNAHRIPRLLLKVRRDNDSLTLSVIDNGVGRNADPGKTKSAKGAFASRGIELTQSRIDNLNQLYGSAKASIRIEDLFEGSVAAGTRIDIVLPIFPETNDED